MPTVLAHDALPLLDLRTSWENGVRRALARFLLGLVLRLEGLAERLDPQGYPKTIDVERRP